MIDLRLSNSKAKVWRRCPKKYEFKYVMGLRAKRKSIQLERGSWLHELIEAYHSGGDWVALHKTKTKEFLTWFEEEREEMGDLHLEVLRIMKGYIRNWASLEKHYVTVDTELDEIITLPNGLRFQMIVDRVYEDKRTGMLWARDVKTVKDFMDEDFLQLDAQLTRYFWGLEWMGYTPLAGVEYDEVRTKAPTLPDVLQNGRLTERKNLRCDYWTYLEQIRKLGQDPEDYRQTLRRLKAQSEHWFRRTQLPKDRSMTTTMMNELVYTAREILRAERTGEFPRTSEKSCTWECEFRDPCIVQLQGGNIKPMLKASYVRNPRRSD